MSVLSCSDGFERRPVRTTRRKPRCGGVFSWAWRCPIARPRWFTRSTRPEGDGGGGPSAALGCTPSRPAPRLLHESCRPESRTLRSRLLRCVNAMQTRRKEALGSRRLDVGTRNGNRRRPLPRAGANFGRSRAPHTGPSAEVLPRLARLRASPRRQAERRAGPASAKGGDRGGDTARARTDAGCLLSRP
jgi:hypothetical protein